MYNNLLNLGSLDLVGVGSSSGKAGLLSSMFYAYVILNKEKNKIYIGQTNNLESRIKRHNGLLATKRRSFTSINKGIWELAYKEEYQTRKEAVSREKYLKSHIGRDWLKSVMGR